MRKQAMELQKQLQDEKIEIDEDGVRIVISGDQKILEFENRDVSDETVRNKLNKAIKSSQEVAARKLSSMTGGLQGLLGK
ncbi:hypothetical protein CO053_02280 [Candidatus Shapirobacteria bacterium CG_4_9_14_0_2_um_filter_40_11]|uniref:Nucleoid-associated protein, YbaB/EbfC family n=4 Tax=Candidatus Shapironibacteriota TaxID=1752721 RepID=A0A2M8EUT8_9BACT|nr:MAG: hypothetical protein CO053_02280 [Candidatus Shapirobacteria bacterium CG_4_9_14_0_2_um_filter_40_11]